MDDLISRKEVLSKMAEYVASGYADSAEDFQAYTNIVVKLPQKTGHWIPWKAYYGEDRKSWSDELKCSECGYKWGDEEYKFCPSCGAKMECEEE